MMAAMHWMPLLLVLAAGLPAEAGEPDAVGQAISLFERGEYLRARELLAVTVAAEETPAQKRGPARLYLAASLHALGESAQSFDRLQELAREHPDQPIDPVLFLPDFIALAKKAAAQVELETQFASRQQTALQPEATTGDEPVATPAPLALPVALVEQASPRLSADPVAVVKPARSSPRIARIAALGVWGLAGTALGAGAYAGLSSASARERLDDARSQTPSVSSMTQREAFDLSERAASMGKASNALFIGAAVLAAGGAVLWVLDDVALAPIPTGAVLTGTLP